MWMPALRKDASSKNALGIYIIREISSSKRIPLLPSESPRPFKGGRFVHPKIIKTWSRLALLMERFCPFK